MTTIPAAMNALLLKLRRGMAASLDAKKTAALFEVIKGFTLTKTTAYKPSTGGWFLKEVPGSSFGRSWERHEDGRIHFRAHVLDGKGSDAYEERGMRADDERKVATLRDDVVPALRAIEASTNKPGKWIIRDVQVREGEIERHDTASFRGIEVTFEFLVKCNVHVITTPDGQTYEVFGDYKNDAIGAQTFPKFFAWAVENTDIMDQILDVLGMEPHEPKDQPGARYVPPKTASVETVKVWEMLVAMTEEIRVEQTQQMIDNLTTGIEAFIAAVEAGDTRRAGALFSGVACHVLSRVYDRRKNTLTDDWQEQVTITATRMVDDMQNAFVAKNTRKLAAILTGKGNMTVAENICVRAVGGVIEGWMRFSFADGSSFRVNNTSVLSFSVHNRPFYRFPTTFHDVVLPGGAKMGLPSEERMIEVFATAKAEG